MPQLSPTILVSTLLCLSAFWVSHSFSFLQNFNARTILTNKRRFLSVNQNTIEGKDDLITSTITNTKYSPINKLSRFVWFSTFGIFLQLSNPLAFIEAVNAQESISVSFSEPNPIWQSSTFFVSDGLISKSATVTPAVPKGKDAPPAAKKDSAPATSVAAVAPKLGEETALESAIIKRNSGKQRLEALSADRKLNEAKLVSLKSEIKSLESAVKKLDGKLKKVEELKDISSSVEYDGTQKKIKKELSDEKAATLKLISEKNIAIKSAQTALERDAAETTSLTRRLKSDEEFVKEKQLALKLKLEAIAKQKAEARAQQLAREVKAAEAEKLKAEGLVKKAAEESKSIKTGLEQLNTEEKKIKESIKQVAQLKKNQEQALATTSQQLDGLVKKDAELQAKVADTKVKLASSEKTVKERLETVDSLAGEVRRLAARR